MSARSTKNTRTRSRAASRASPLTCPSRYLSAACRPESPVSLHGRLYLCLVWSSVQNQGPCRVATENSNLQEFRGSRKALRSCEHRHATRHPQICAKYQPLSRERVRWRHYRRQIFAALSLLADEQEKIADGCRKRRSAIRRHSSALSAALAFRRHSSSSIVISALAG
jgi:hypothetical protein